LATAISRGVRFFTRQDRDWKVSALRTNVTMFLYKLVLPYLAVYTMALGATGTQLGIINSVGMGVSAISGLLGGGIIDKIGVKKIYLLGIVILAASYLIYGFAGSWPILVFAMIAYWFGNNTSVLGCSVVCANCLKSEDRATGMAICETFGMGLLSLAAPMLGAWIVTAFGGVNVQGIRPLFFICAAGVAFTFFLILIQLSNRNWRITGRVDPSFLQGFAQVFKEGHNLKRWLIIASLTGMEMGMVTPYIQPFANQFKGADQFVLGAMITASSVVPLVLGIPLGRLSDKIGRKKVIYLTALPVVASYIMLIYAPNSFFLTASGALQGFVMITGITTTAMSRELVPAEQMGRWTGIIGFFRMGLAAIMTYVCGLIWDHIGPQYVFWFILVFYVIRLPLLIGMPETLASTKKLA
jgi:DHA1 family solute carrier family 18 vesicular amine transporter 1/2